MTLPDCVQCVGCSCLAGEPVGERLGEGVSMPEASSRVAEADAGSVEQGGVGMADHPLAAALVPFGAGVLALLDEGGHMPDGESMESRGSETSHEAASEGHKVRGRSIAPSGKSIPETFAVGSRHGVAP